MRGVREIVFHRVADILRQRREIRIAGIGNNLADQKQRVAFLHEGRSRLIGGAFFEPQVDEAWLGERALQIVKVID